MKKPLLFLLVFLPFISLAQNPSPSDTVDIPDPHFKWALLHPDNYGDQNSVIDINENGEIEYSEAEAVTYLNLLDITLGVLDVQTQQLTPPNENEPEQGVIHDLTGIEAFTNLTYLNVGSDNGGSNQLDSLDLTQNTALDTVIATGNVLTHLKIGNNPNLLYLDCSLNDLTNLDVSQCTGIEYLNCKINPLEKVDIRNGNNENLTFFSIGCYYDNPDCNPNPTCIFVDNVSYFENNFPTDSTYHYVENEEQCAEALGVKGFTIEKVRVYPNPVKSSLYIIEQKPIKKIILYNLQGKRLKVFNHLPQGIIDFTSYPSGIYFLRFKNSNQSQTHKIIKL